MMAGLFRFGLVVVALVVTSVISYRVAVRQVETQDTQIQEAVTSLREANERLEREALRRQAAVRTVEIRYEELVRRFEAEMPTGPLLELTQLAAARLEEGLDVERLAFYIREAAEPRDCSSLNSKRFVLPTPAYQGPDTTVSFDEGRISITGFGENAVAANGGIQGWFEPASEVSITFTVIDGDTVTVSGVLPLQKSVVLEDQEFRFAIQQGRRSFVKVTADRCPFP